MTDQDFFITAAIDYTNGEPHLGHTYEKILGDTLARFQRLSGRKVVFIMGTDEHGEKIAKAAAKLGLSPQAFVDDLSQRAFQGLWRKLGIQYDHFIRTTDEPHQHFVQQILQRVYDAGDIYFAEYEGLYSVGAERYVTEKELVAGPDGVARYPGDKDPPELRREGNYFFKMEKYQPWLRAHLDQHPGLIQPAGYRNEVLEMLKEPIGDLSISRPKSRVPWGIELPWDPEHVTYVWFDALLSYLTPLVEQGLDPAQTLPHTWHVIGKDILKPHAVFWPTMLRAAGYPCYQRLVVHSHILAEDGRKMGKSLGNALDPHELLKSYPQDALRYTILREATLHHDSLFGPNILVSRLTSDLANDLGNLLSRTISMVQKYRDGLVPVPTPQALGPAEEQIAAAARALPGQLAQLFDELKVNLALDAAMEFVRRLNRYIAESEPWALAKQAEQQARLDGVLYTTVEGLRVASVALEAVIPNKARELRAQLGLGDSPYRLSADWGLTPAGTRVVGGPILFPKPEVNPEVPMTESTVPVPPTPTETSSLISIDDFAKLDLRIAEVIACEPVEKADKLLKLTVKLGQETRTVVSGIRKWFEPEALIGRKVVLVANLKPAKLRGIESQGMILAAEDAEGRLDLVGLTLDLPSGTKVR